MAESLQLTSTAIAVPADPPLPHSVVSETTSSTLRREEWMLEPNMSPTPPEPSSRLLEPGRHTEDSLTEDYGESNNNTRTVAGGVDFFSSLGKERKKRPAPKLEQVRLIVYYRWRIALINTVVSKESAIESSMSC